MDHLEEVSTATLSDAFQSNTNSNVESGIVNLIEAAEKFRRYKIEPTRSYSETFFSAAKQYLG